VTSIHQIFGGPRCKGFTAAWRPQWNITLHYIRNYL